MHPGVQALLTGLIDYAGLFPPAQLPLPEALAHYARYRRGRDAWMLGRFLCPASRLAEWPTGDEALQAGPPWRISALGRGGASTSHFLEGLRRDLEAIADFHAQWPGRAVVDVFEVKLPGDVAEEFWPAVAEEIETPPCPPLRAVFHEAIAGFVTRHATEQLVAALAEDNRRRGRSHPRVSGLKLRCGGLAGPRPYPTAEQIAFTLASCRDAGVPFKATAGLHHPFPTPDAVGKLQHGFVNLFVAGVLAHARRIDEQQIRLVLECQRAADFTFDADGLRWHDLRASVDEIATARDRAVSSFGSCSFDEPCNDLRGMGLLPRG